MATTTSITLKVSSKVICSPSVLTDFIVLLAGWSTTKNSDAALFEVCLRHVVRGEQETVSIGKNLSSVCVGTSQPEDQREQTHEAN